MRRTAQIKSSTRRAKIHPAEKALVGMLSAHLIAMPWALGTMWWQTQVASLGLSLVGFGLCLLPRDVVDEDRTRLRVIPFPKLLRFPPFWLGLILLGYLAMQAFNPNWAYTEKNGSWWLSRLDFLHWLPTSIKSPFIKFNAWRQMIIYSDSWLLMCSIWVGLTERRTLRFFLSSLVLSACALGVVLAIQHSSANFSLPWAPEPWSSRGFTATFVYKNHAGAYFALIAFAATALGLWSMEYGIRTMKRSSPTLIWMFIALSLACAVGFSLSRGALIILALVGLIAASWFAWWNCQLPSRKQDLRLTMTIVAALLLFLATAAKYLDFSDLHNRFAALTESRGYELSVGSRVMARHAAWNMLKNTGIYGIGAGGFRFLFPEYVKFYPEIYDQGHLFWEHAHCDWLEIPIELGIVGDVIIGSWMLWWTRLFFRTRAWHSPIVVLLLLGCLQTLIHATFEFPFACPAILATWCSFVAIAAKWSELSID